MNKAKRELKNITFQFDGGHIAITDESEPACSGAVDAILFKSLTDNQKEILDELGVDPILATKSKSASDESLNGSQHKADTPTKNKKETDNMSEAILKAMQDKLDAQEHSINVMVVEKSLAGFELEPELKAELAGVLAGVEGVETVIKALDALVAVKAVAVEKALEGKVDKADEELNPLAKSLSEEAGEAGEGHEVKLTKAEKVNKHIESKAKA